MFVWLCVANRSIKDIASGFNLADELMVSLNGLLTTAKQLKCSEAREGADERVQQLQRFIIQLADEGVKPSNQGAHAWHHRHVC